MSSSRHKRRHPRPENRVVTVRWTDTRYPVMPEGYVQMPDGWRPEAGKEYAIFTVRYGDEPEERWYREVNTAPEVKPS